MDKHTANTLHALKRAKERYNADLTYADIEAILERVKNFKDCRKVEQLSLRRASWIVQYNGYTLIPVIETNKKAGRYSIVTFLPPT